MFPLEDMEVFYLTLVRHGETTENQLKILQVIAAGEAFYPNCAQKISLVQHLVKEVDYFNRLLAYLIGLSGHRDTVLSQKGIRQAQLLAERLKNEHFTHIFTSDLQRAKQTCKIIMETNAASDAHIIEDKRLRERKLGSLEGKSWDDWQDLRNKCSLKHEESAGMETRQDLRDHAVSFFQHLCHLMRSVSNENQSGESEVQFSLESPSTNKNAEVPEVRAAASRGNSKKRKHIGSGSSLSDLDGQSPLPADDRPSGSVFFEGAASERRQSFSSSSSSSSSSGCSSTTATPGEFETDVSELAVAASYVNANILTDPTVDHPATLSDQADVFAALPCDGWPCPNVALPSLPGRPIARVSSVGSGRCSGSIDENPFLDLPPPFASVLVVSHGGLIAELIGHFVEELNCRLPGGRRAAQQVTPNAGLSRFSVTLLPPVDEDEANDPAAWIQSRIECLALHDKDHLANDLEAAPLPVIEAF